jgi:hypothetical protein
LIGSHCRHCGRQGFFEGVIATAAVFEFTEFGTVPVFDVGVVTYYAGYSYEFQSFTLAFEKGDHFVLLHFAESGDGNAIVSLGCIVANYDCVLLGGPAFDHICDFKFPIFVHYCPKLIMPHCSLLLSVF